MARIAIIVDSTLRHTNRRPCFWQSPYWSQWFTGEGCQVDFVSIIDEIGADRNPAAALFDRHRYDIIIISWDVINGDPVFGSDVALAFFQHYVARLNRWAGQGGIVIVEAQTASFRLVRDAYRPFTYDSEGLDEKYSVAV